MPAVRRWLSDALRFPSGLRIGERIRMEMVDRWYRFRALASVMTLLMGGTVVILGYHRALLAIATAVVVLGHAIATRARPQVILAITLDVGLSFLTLELLGVTTAVLSLLYVAYAVITVLLCDGVGRMVVGTVASAAFAVAVMADWSDPSIPELWTQVGGFLASVVFVLLLVATVSVAVDILQRHVTEADESNRRLDALIRSKDALISTMSHELRTPLTAVLGFAAALQDGWSTMDDDERRSLAGVIAAESESMAHVTENMIVASRAELGTLYIKLACVSLAEAVDRFFGAYPSDSRNIGTLGTGAEVYVDPARLQQVLRALTSNAVRFGGDRVWIELDHSPHTGVLRVCDDGPGIPEPHREDVFLPFERAHETPTQPGSLGLGLAVARRLTEAMGGTIEYRRRAEVTVFELVFPRADAGNVSRPEKTLAFPQTPKGTAA